MNAYEIARAEATRVVEAAYRKAVAAGELPEGTEAYLAANDSAYLRCGGLCLQG